MKVAAANGATPARAASGPLRRPRRRVARPTSRPGTDLGSDADARRRDAPRRGRSGRPTFTPPVTLFGADDRKLVQLVAFQPCAAGRSGRATSPPPSPSTPSPRTSRRRSRPAPARPSRTATPASRASGTAAAPPRPARSSWAGATCACARASLYDEGTPWDELMILLGPAGRGRRRGVRRPAPPPRGRRELRRWPSGSPSARRSRPTSSLERGFSATLIAALPDGFVAADNRGVILVNDAMCRLTGFSRRELTGRLFPHGFWPEERLAEIQRLRDRADGDRQRRARARRPHQGRRPHPGAGQRVHASPGRHGPVEIYLIRDNRERAEETARLAESRVVTAVPGQRRDGHGRPAVARRAHRVGVAVRGAGARLRARGAARAPLQRPLRQRGHRAARRRRPACTASGARTGPRSGPRRRSRPPSTTAAR